MFNIKGVEMREEDVQVLGEIATKFIDGQFADGKYRWRIAHDHKMSSDISFEVANGDLFVTDII